MKHYCHYHPSSLAKWYCEHCHLYYDKVCVPDANVLEKKGVCLKCRSALQFIDKQYENRPYWQITTQFFLMPFNVEALWVVTLSILLSLFYSVHSVATVLVPLLIISLLAHYGRQINKSFVGLNIKDSMPTLTFFLSFSKIKSNVDLIFLLALGLIGPILLDRYVGLISALILVIASLSSLPALMLIFLKDEGELKEKVNQLKKMGVSYLGLVGYLSGAYLVSIMLLDFSLQHFTPFLTSAITSLSSAYFGIVLFSMLAYISNQQTSQITEKILENDDTTKFQGSTFYDGDDQRLEARIDIALKRGEFLKVTSLLEKELKRDNSSDLRRDQLYQLFKAQKNLQGLEKYSLLFLALQLGRGKLIDIAELLMLLKSYNPAFRVNDSHLSAQLAEGLYKIHQYSLVVWLAEDAHVRFPVMCEQMELKRSVNHDVASLYLLAAKTLLAKLDDRKKAYVLLKYITANFEDDPLFESAVILQTHVFKKNAKHA